MWAAAAAGFDVDLTGVVQRKVAVPHGDVVVGRMCKLLRGTKVCGSGVHAL